MRKKKIPKEDRYNRSVLKALEFIRVYDIQWFPVDPRNIFKSMNQLWLLFSVEESEKIYGGKNPFGVSVVKGVDAKNYSCSDGRYIIIYDKKTLESRITWTLAHEIGHIYLDHFEDFNLTSIDRSSVFENNSITQAEYDVLEREADTFAAEILSPMVVLLETNVTLRNDLIRSFLLSGYAAENRERDIKYRRKRYIYKHLFSVYVNQFSLFLSPVVFCQNNNHSHEKKFKSSHVKVVYMSNKALFAHLNQEGKFCICPQCGNVEFSDHSLYCKMCGIYLFNDCQNQPNDFDSSYCGKRNPGDARYCEYCGQQTYLLKAGLIMTWEEVIAEKGEIYEGLNFEDRFEPQKEKILLLKEPSDPFADDGPPIEIDDSDLPF